MANKGARGIAAIEPNWLLNFVTALIVAIVAGVVVWLLTKPEPNSASVTYEINETGTFISTPESLHFFTTIFRNSGKTAATGLVVDIGSSANSYLTNYSVTTSATKPKVNWSVVNKNRIRAEIPVLKPQEVIKFSIGYKSKEKIEFKVFASNNNGVVEEFVPESQGSNFRDNPYVLYGSFLLFALASFVINLFIRKYLRRIIGRTHLGFSGSNNSAFLLMHSGNFSDAKNILLHALSNERSQPIILSNYALILALEGKLEKAEDLISAIIPWVSEGTHMESVVEFNRIIISILGGNDMSEELLKLSEENEDIKKYISFSKLIKTLIENGQVNLNPQ